MLKSIRPSFWDCSELKVRDNRLKETQTLTHPHQSLDRDPYLSYSAILRLLKHRKEMPESAGVASRHLARVYMGQWTRSVKVREITIDSDPGTIRAIHLRRNVQNELPTQDSLELSDWPYANEDEVTVLEYLKGRGKDEIAERIHELIRGITVCPDDSEMLDIESLRHLATFLVKCNPPYTPHGVIVASYDGTLGVEWRLPLRHAPDNQWKNCDGILSMRFLPSGAIVYVGETRQIGEEQPFHVVGEDEFSVASKQVDPFFDILRSADAER